METNPDNHTNAIALCQNYIKDNPHDFLAPIAKSTLGWLYLKTGKLREGILTFAPLLNRRSGNLSKAASNTARTWLTRIDIERVKASLFIYYKEHVEFPESLSSLETLPKKERPPTRDRWGQEWTYRLVGFKMLKTVPKNQKYEIQAPLLGKDSDFKAALSIPYASRINVNAVKMLSTAHGRESIQFETADDKKTKFIISAGSSSHNINLAYVGEKLIILSDGNHWKFLSKPR